MERWEASASRTAEAEGSRPGACPGCARLARVGLAGRGGGARPRCEGASARAPGTARAEHSTAEACRSLQPGASTCTSCRAAPSAIHRWRANWRGTRFPRSVALWCHRRQGPSAWAKGTSTAAETPSRIHSSNRRHGRGHGRNFSGHVHAELHESQPPGVQAGGSAKHVEGVAVLLGRSRWGRAARLVVWTRGRRRGGVGTQPRGAEKRSPAARALDSAAQRRCGPWYHCYKDRHASSSSSSWGDAVPGSSRTRCAPCSRPHQWPGAAAAHRQRQHACRRWRCTASEAPGHRWDRHAITPAAAGRSQWAAAAAGCWCVSLIETSGTLAPAVHCADAKLRRPTVHQSSAAQTTTTARCGRPRGGPPRVARGLG